MGRNYRSPPGPAPLNIEYNEVKDEIQNMVLDIASWLDRPILEELIRDGYLILMKSHGRNSNAKLYYVLAIKNNVKSLLNAIYHIDASFNYCIELTEKFFKLSKDNQYEMLSHALKRIPDVYPPSGKLKPFDSFSGFDGEIQTIRENIQKADNHA